MKTAISEMKYTLQGIKNRVDKAEDQINNLEATVAENTQSKYPSVSESVKKLWYIYTMKYYAAERKKETLPFMTAWMEMESIMLSEISQVVKDKYCMISPLSET